MPWSGSCVRTEGWIAVSARPGRSLCRPAEAEESRADAILLQGPGLVVAGNLDWKQLAVWRLRPDGSEDRTFGEAGRTLTPNGMGRGLLPAEGGGLWVAGFRYAGTGEKTTREETVLTLLDTAGRPDPDFGTAGALILSREGRLSGQESFAIAEESGRMFLAGYTGAEDIVRAAVWPFDRQGVQTGGIRELPGPETGGEDRAYALTVAEGGDAWVTGFSKDLAGRRLLALWRVAGR